MACPPAGAEPAGWLAGWLDPAMMRLPTEANVVTSED